MKRCLYALLAVAVFASPALAADVPADLEQNIADDGAGIISDYSGMVEGDGLDWIWVAPEIRLAEHRFTVSKVENLTIKIDDDLMHVFEDNLPRQLNRAGSRDENAPVLDVRVGIHWVERANTAKAWIPFAGGHLMQAGAAAELVFTAEDGTILAKIRHSAREGQHLKDAGQEISDDVAEFVHAH